MTTEPVLRHRSDLTGSEVWEGDARRVAAAMAPGSCSLAILDGAYGWGKSKVWDAVKMADLPEWYRPHLEDVDRVCGPSASLYLWNTAEGWAAVHPVILSMGWTFRALVVWDKTVAAITAYHARPQDWRKWKDQTEVCGFYQREEWAPSTCAGSEIAYAAGADDRNWVRLWLGAEWTAAGLRRSEADKAMGTNGMAGHYFGASQWSLPTWEAYQTLAAYAVEHGAERDRPYLVHPDIWAGEDRDALRATYDHLRATYDHLRAEYEASRPAFTCPMGIGNVWTHLPVAGPERLRGPDGETLHACQKPLEFSERMIRASTRPGESVWAPFGGTLREAVAAERIARADPAEARRVITAELNQDGVDYIGPALRQLQGLGTRRVDPRQASLFGGAR
jgi:hypothetical protein